MKTKGLQETSGLEITPQTRNRSVMWKALGGFSLFWGAAAGKPFYGETQAMPSGAGWNAALQPPRFQPVLGGTLAVPHHGWGAATSCPSPLTLCSRGLAPGWESPPSARSLVAPSSLRTPPPGRGPPHQASHSEPLGQGCCCGSGQSTRALKPPAVWGGFAPLHRFQAAQHRRQPQRHAGAQHPPPRHPLPKPPRDYRAADNPPLSPRDPRTFWGWVSKGREAKHPPNPSPWLFTSLGSQL